MKRKIITDLEKLKNPAKVTNIAVENEEVKTALDKAIKNLKDTLNYHEGLLALCAPQIGTDMRIIGIKFNDSIKIFINPVITKKLQYSIGGETCASMPGKEILLARPEEISLVYYNEKLVYEDNKLLGAAARLFDQQAQLLDGVTPDELGLVSDIELDGPISTLSEEDFEQVKQIYCQFISAKSAGAEQEMKENEETAAHYRELKFAEMVISGKAAIVEDESKRIKNKQRRSATGAMVRKSMRDASKLEAKTKLDAFLKKIGK